MSVRVRRFSSCAESQRSLKKWAGQCIKQCCKFKLEKNWSLSDWHSFAESLHRSNFNGYDATYSTTKKLIGLGYLHFMISFSVSSNSPNLSQKSVNRRAKVVFITTFRTKFRTGIYKWRSFSKVTQRCNTTILQTRPLSELAVCLILDGKIIVLRSMSP